MIKYFTIEDLLIILIYRKSFTLSYFNIKKRRYKVKLFVAKYNRFLYVVPSFNLSEKGGNGVE